MNRNQLIEDNLNLVYFIVNKYYPTYIRDEDVIQEGMIGLCKAADKYEEGKCAFSTYASMCIVNSIRQYFRRNSKHSGVLSLDKEVKSSNEKVNYVDAIPGDEDVSLDELNYEGFYNTLSQPDKHLLDVLRTHNTLEASEILGVSRQWISQKRRNLKQKWRKFNGYN